DPYGDGRKPVFPSVSRKKHLQHKKGKKRAGKRSRADCLIRSRSYQKSFAISVDEAEHLKCLSNQERLQKCSYLPKGNFVQMDKKDENSKKIN
ncbi:hypothetical protein, partial [Salmonella sp. s55004]|uniref:hypothetical protein n=1 Tax=Salmonella sp. s55004 TaxID=3159675 RepID=UPI0039811723